MMIAPPQASRAAALAQTEKDPDRRKARIEDPRRPACAAGIRATAAKISTVPSAS